MSTSRWNIEICRTDVGEQRHLEKICTAKEGIYTCLYTSQTPPLSSPDDEAVYPLGLM